MMIVMMRLWRCKAFEHLCALELVRPVTAGGGHSQRLPADYRTMALHVDPSEIMDALQRYPSCPTDVKQWAACSLTTAVWTTNDAAYSQLDWQQSREPWHLQVFWRRKSQQNSNEVPPNGGAKCRRGRLNAGSVAANWRLSTQGVVNLVRSQIYHTERPPHLFVARSPLCSTSRGFVSDSWSLLL